MLTFWMVVNSSQLPTQLPFQEGATAAAASGSVGWESRPATGRQKLIIELLISQAGRSSSRLCRSAGRRALAVAARPPPPPPPLCRPK